MQGPDRLGPGIETALNDVTAEGIQQAALRLGLHAFCRHPGAQPVPQRDDTLDNRLILS